MLLRSAVAIAQSAKRWRRASESTQLLSTLSVRALLLHSFVRTDSKARRQPFCARQELFKCAVAALSESLCTRVRLQYFICRDTRVLPYAARPERVQLRTFMPLLVKFDKVGEPWRSYPWSLWSSESRALARCQTCHHASVFGSELRDFNNTKLQTTYFRSILPQRTTAKAAAA